MTKYVHILVNLAGLTVAVYFGVGIFYRAVEAHLLTKDDHQAASTVQIHRETQKTIPLSHYQIITDRAILGSRLKEDIQNEVDIKAEQIAQLKPTSLNIALLGTVAGSDETAFAVILEKGKREQNLYHPGETVQGAILRKVLRNKVILEVNGKNEILEMEMAKNDTKGSGRISSARGENITVAHDDLQNSLKNINSLLTQVRIRPLIKNGKPDGLVLSRIKRNSIFAKLGLKNGDVVKRIDNRVIRTPDDAFTFYNRLKSGSEISLEIGRGSETKVFNYRFE